MKNNIPLWLNNLTEYKLGCAYAPSLAEQITNGALLLKTLKVENLTIKSFCLSFCNSNDHPDIERSRAFSLSRKVREAIYTDNPEEVTQEVKDCVFAYYSSLEYSILNKYGYIMPETKKLINHKIQWSEVC